jgi:drug/metabolite transporter (DMT)-like permease
MKKGILLAILAASLYAISSPLSKILLNYIPPMLTAGLLYIGAGFGMSIFALIRKNKKKVNTEYSLTKKDVPYTLLMIVLDIAAPILLMIGLNMTTSANVSLLNNFEIVATSVIALVIFKEVIGKRLWLGISLITIASLLLSFEDLSSFSFSFGSLFVLLACLCWGLENNCTRKLSSKDPLQIVIIKGLFSGFCSIIIGLIFGERITVIWSVFAVLGIGFVAYGLSIYFYVYAQRLIGAARTSAFYAVSPFIGAGLSLIIFQNNLNWIFFVSLSLMIVGAYFSSTNFGRKKKITDTNIESILVNNEN